MAHKDVVLVVEDEALVRNSIVLDLKDAGFEVIAAGTGDEASFLLPKMQRIDLLLTDIRMPGRINGWVLADMARCRRPNLPIIYTSGFASLRRRYRKSKEASSSQNLIGPRKSSPPSIS